MTKCSVVALMAVLGIAIPAAAQIVPSELLEDRDSADHSSSQADARRTLDVRESLRRIRSALELLRKGSLDEAVSRLRGPDYAVSFDIRTPGVDAREVDAAWALIDYVDGRNRQAFERADAVHRVGRPGMVNVDAAIIKSLVLLRVGVYAYSDRWAKWAKESAPETPLVLGLITSLRKTAPKGSYRGEEPTVHPTAADYRLEVWQGPEHGDQPLTVVLRKELMFEGALLIEASPPVGTTARRYRVTFRDLDGPPLIIRDCGTVAPDRAELTTLAEQLHPGRTTGRYGIPRAELESLYWWRDRATPLAAWWARHADDSPLVGQYVVAPLQQSNDWEWKLRDRREVGPPGEAGFTLLGFSNVIGDDPARLKELRGPLQRFHFLAITHIGNQNLVSFVVNSREPIPEARLYFLERLDGDESRELKLYDGLESPTYEQVADELEELLTQAAAEAAKPPISANTSP